MTYYRDPRFQTLVLGTFAALALGLTALGTYGVVAFLAAVRWHEMGVRLAIGGSPPALIRLLLRKTAAPVMLGLLLGLAGTLRLNSYRQSHDPWIPLLATVTVAGAAMLAAYFPARRVARIDPNVALRHE